MILLLDADERRHSCFQEQFPKVVIAKTVSEAKEALSYQTWSQVWLGYNLDQELLIPSNSPNCGMKLVNWVVQNRPRVDVFVVHALNFHGACQMETTLFRAGYFVVRIPFGNFTWFTQERRKHQ